jgi:hypothetical protein
MPGASVPRNTKTASAPAWALGLTPSSAIATAAPMVRIRFFGFPAARNTAIAAARGVVRPSTFCIQAGSSGSASPAPRPRHCHAATRRRSTPGQSDGATSIRTTAITAAGLNATPRPKASTSPIAWVMTRRARCAQGSGHPRRRRTYPFPCKARVLATSRCGGRALRPVAKETAGTSRVGARRAFLARPTIAGPAALASTR